MLGFRDLSAACTEVMRAEDEVLANAFRALRTARDRAIGSIDALL